MADNNIERINDNTIMIDLDLFGVKRVGAVYLVSAGKTCLIDSGTGKEAMHIVRALDSVGSFPPDMLILTHSHFDHSQGTPVLRREAKKRGYDLPVMASEKAIANLADQSWNRVFDKHHKFENITDAEPLQDSQVLDLQGLELEVIDFHGHCEDDIALYDRRNKTVFIGDSIGYSVAKTLVFPPFMPPFWSPQGFLDALEKLQKIDYDALCLAHFGCLQGKEAETFPDTILDTYRIWWHVFSETEKQGKLEDVKYLKEQLIKEAGIVFPDLEISSTCKRLALLVVNHARAIVGKNPIRVAEVQMEVILKWLTKGYKHYKSLAH